MNNDHFWWMLISFDEGCWSLLMNADSSWWKIIISFDECWSLLMNADQSLWRVLMITFDERWWSVLTRADDHFLLSISRWNSALLNFPSLFASNLWKCNETLKILHHCFMKHSKYCIVLWNTQNTELFCPKISTFALQVLSMSSWYHGYPLFSKNQKC